MDEQTKRQMQQAIEFAKQRRERECKNTTPSPMANLLSVMPARTEGKPSRGLKTVMTGVYPDFLFDSDPANYSREADDLCYPCPTCGMIPGVIKRSNGYRRRPCPCVEQERERQDLQRVREKIREERLAAPAKERVTYTWLGLDYGSLAERSLTNFEMQYQQKAFGLAAGYMKRILTKGSHLENILIYGERAGLGKTHLAAALLNCAYESGYSCLFCTAKDYFDALWAADFKSRLALRQRASKADFLLIDDIDKADAKDPTAQKNEFFQLLNVRYEAGRPTLFTANSQDLSRWFNEWTISRVQERLLRIPVSGADYRQIRAERARLSANTAS